MGSEAQSVKIEKSPWGDRKQLVNDGGVNLLESSVIDGKLLFIKGSLSTGGRPGEYVSKEDLEKLLDVKIFDNNELPKVEVEDDNEFGVDGYVFSYSADRTKLRQIGLRYLVAANELARQQVELAEKERAEEERIKRETELARFLKVETERIESNEAEGKKRREIAKIRDALAHEGVAWPQGVAESLYAAGVRANG